MLDYQVDYEQYWQTDRMGRHYHQLFVVNHNEHDLVESNLAFRRARDLLKQSVSKCISYLQENNIDFKGFYRMEVDKIISSRPDTKSIPFVIELAWTSSQADVIKGNLYELAEYLLAKPKLNGYSEIYLEQIVDLLNYTTEIPIPLSILRGICLAEHEAEVRYGAFIKAISYLNDHPLDKRNVVLAELRATERYKTDEYYRDWID